MNNWSSFPPDWFQRAGAIPTSTTRGTHLPYIDPLLVPHYPSLCFLNQPLGVYHLPLEVSGDLRSFQDVEGASVSRVCWLMFTVDRRYLPWFNLLHLHSERFSTSKLMKDPGLNSWGGVRTKILSLDQISAKLQNPVLVSWCPKQETGQWCWGASLVCCALMASCFPFDGPAFIFQLLFL